MARRRRLSLHLDPATRQRAMAGQHNFINIVRGVTEAAGFETVFRLNNRATRRAALLMGDHSLTETSGPVHRRALTLRLCHHYPFWHIERSGTRWDWPVAGAAFDPATLDRAEAARFAGYWRRQVFGDAAEGAAREGFVLVPLQARLTERRGFQSCSPMEMLAHLAAGQDRPLRITLHPRAQLSRAERRALDAFLATTPRAALWDGGMVEGLRRCDMVATQNSSVAFWGYFFGKPALLFARSEFHHIAADATRLGIAAALAAAPGLKPDYDAYIYWFWQIQAINAGRPDAARRVAAALRRHGWPV